MPIERIRKLSWISIALLGIPGCGADVGSSIIEAAQRHRQSMPKLETIDDDLTAANKEARLVTSENTPSPGRLNPFEIASTFESESDAPDRSHGKREIRVLGFIEVDKPMVILSIDGRSQSFSAGDTQDRITVTEVSPPRARITLDGVTWYASIFDPR